ncbi:MAG: threonine synthase, partial [Sphingomonadales bacterium]|nr:threonine synthase [Sphingomonadales bacterium]
MTIKFESTRGKAPAIGLVDAALSGLAPDGGLYVPCAFPSFSADDIAALKGKDFLTVAAAVLAPFFEGVMNKDDVDALVKDGFSRFTDPAIVPIREMAPNVLMMELYHGPTLAFKDVALQVFGRLLDRLLAQRDAHVTIVGATSGDTGSAAIHAVMGSKRARIFMLHPLGRVSDVQRRQMTSVMDDNVVNIAIDGSFDDAQAIVKALLSDPDLRAEGLTTVNSINWVRVMVQVAYHAYAAITHPGVDMVVPSGNFGNAYAGHVARKMGFPIGRIVIATNENDILV